MSLLTVQTKLLDVLREVQELSGRPWKGLRLDARPIGNLDGFDSLSGIEATVMIEEKFGCSLDIDSVFVSKDGKRALTVNDIATRIAAAVSSEGLKR